MDTELLRTFLEVRATRHFGRAAESLCITQAAVSARIKQLEELLGASLFDRSRNNIHLSAEGERLVPHAEAMLLALARARQEIQLGESRGQRLVLGVLNGLWCDALQQKLHQLMSAKPDLMLTVEGLASADLLRRLLDRTLDAAICYDPPGVPELEVLSIGELTLDRYRGKSAKQHNGDAGVYLDWGGSFARFHARDAEGEGMPRLKTNLEVVAAAYLAQHGGTCYLPRSARATLAESGVKRERGAPVFTRSLSFVNHSGSSQLELIEEAARQFAGLKL